MEKGYLPYNRLKGGTSKIPSHNIFVRIACINIKYHLVLLSFLRFAVQSTFQRLQFDRSRRGVFFSFLIGFFCFLFNCFLIHRLFWSCWTIEDEEKGRLTCYEQHGRDDGLRTRFGKGKGEYIYSHGFVQLFFFAWLKYNVCASLCAALDIWKSVCRYISLYKSSRKIGRV